MAKLVGYARVSTEDQEVALQRDALQAAGCRPEWIFVDKVSGAAPSAPGWTPAWTRWRPETRWWCGGSTGWAAPCRTWWP